MSRTMQESDTGITTIEFEGQTFRFWLPDAEDYISRTMAREGVFYERDMLSFIHQHAHPGTWAVDVGANIGNHTVFLAGVCGLRVRALEPLPRCFEILERNIELNELDEQVVAERRAAGRTRGTGRLIPGPADNLGQTRVVPGEGDQIEIVPLDSLEFDAPVSLLKVDVEGMECEVLLGARELIERHRPAIYVEAQDPRHRRAVERILAPLGYQRIACFNWTPTYLFVSVRDADERFAALTLKVGVLERHVEQHRGDALRWKQQVEQLWQHRADLHKQLGAARESAQNWQHQAGALQAELAELRARHERLKHTCGELEKQRARLETASNYMRQRAARQAEDLRDWRQRVDQLSETLRSTQTIVERLSARIADMERENQRLREQIAQLSRERQAARLQVQEIVNSRSYKLARRIAGAARRVRSAARYRPWRRPEAGAAATSPGAAPAGRAAIEARHKQLRADFERWTTQVAQGDFSHAVLMFGGTVAIQRVRANRPIRLTLAFEQMGVPVLFNFHRWRESDPIPDYDGGLVLQSPTDRTPGLAERLFTRDLGRTHGVFVVSYPYPTVCRLINLANANGWATIYDCRDDWEEFAEVGMAKWYRRSVEEYVVRNCDLTCCVSGPLCEKLRGYGTGQPVHLLPNAYDPQFRSPDYRHRPGAEVVVGYFGHLTDRWFDWDALLKIMAARPQYKFEIIGHGEPKGLQLPPNARLLGPRTHAEICRYAARWHAAMIPFKPSRLADGVDPIKIYEYFALGLPVVSFRMPQIADYPHTRTVDTPDEFLAALDQAIRNRPDPQDFEQFLATRTWQHRAQQMLDWADEILAQPTVEKTFGVVAVGSAAPTSDSSQPAAATAPPRARPLGFLQTDDFQRFVQHQTDRWDQEWLGYFLRHDDRRHMYFTSTRNLSDGEFDWPTEKLRAWDARQVYYFAPWRGHPLEIWVPGARLLESRVAEIGCGTGTLGKLLATAGISYLGIDFSRLALEVARRVSPDRAHYVNLSDVAELERFGGWADLCVGRHFFIHQNRESAAWVLRLQRFLLCKGGWICADFFRRGNDPGKYPTAILPPEASADEHLPSSVFEYDQAAIESLAEECQLRVVRIDDVPDLQRRFVVLEK